MTTPYSYYSVQHGQKVETEFIKFVARAALIDCMYDGYPGHAYMPYNIHTYVYIHNHFGSSDAYMCVRSLLAPVPVVPWRHLHHGELW